MDDINRNLSRLQLFPDYDTTPMSLEDINEMTTTKALMHAEAVLKEIICTLKKNITDIKLLNDKIRELVEISINGENAFKKYQEIIEWVNNNKSILDLNNNVIYNQNELKKLSKQNLKNTLNIGTTIFTYNYDDVSKSIDKLKNCGINTLRIGCYWWNVEQQKGIYNFSDVKKIVELLYNNNFNIIINYANMNELYATPEDDISNLGNYRNKTSFKTNEQIRAYEKSLLELAKHLYTNGFTGLSYEVFNEPNNKGLNPFDYCKINNYLYTSLKEIDKNIKVYSMITEGVWSNWQKTAIDNGILDYTDGIAVHPYSLTTPEDIFKQINTLQQYIDLKTSKYIPVIIGEVGWNSNPNDTTSYHRASDQKRGEFYKRVILLSLSKNINDIIFFQAFDKMDNTDKKTPWYGIIKSNTLEETETYRALKDITDLFKEYSFNSNVELTNDYSIIEIEKDKERKYIGWTFNHDKKFYSNIFEQSINFTTNPNFINVNKTINSLYPRYQTLNKTILNCFKNFDFANPIKYLGLMSPTSPYSYSLDMHDNKMIKSGYCQYMGNIKNKPTSNTNDFGIILSFQTQSYCAHIVYSFLENNIYYERYNGTNWSGYSLLNKYEDNYQTIEQPQYTIIKEGKKVTLCLNGPTVSTISTINNFLPKKSYITNVYNATKNKIVVLTVSPTNITVGGGSDSTDGIIGQLTWII